MSSLDFDKTGSILDSDVVDNGEKLLLESYDFNLFSCHSSYKFSCKYAIID